jgi:DNA repair exonuclease SbcCD ATPase subunit
MTEEELKAKLEETEAELAKVKREKDTLEKNQSNQNAYITKLEEKANGLSEQIKSIQAAANKPALDPQITAYFKKKYVEDYINEGKEEIKKRDSKGVFAVLEEELDSFLKQFMNESNASIKFVLDSYSLILGRAYADPEHPINKLDITSEGAKNQKVQPQPAEPQVIVNPNFPPTMTDGDQGAGNPAAKKTIDIPDTKSAFKVLEDKLFNQGRNKFE